MRGELDDPEFGIAGLIAGALGDLITKVALSPFSLVGGLVGFDADEMRIIEFAPGSAELAGAQLRKIEALSTALMERPGLSLELVGGAGPAIDRPALQAASLDAQIRRARFEELQSNWIGDKPTRVEDIVLTQKDSRRLHMRQYEERFGESPKKLLVQELTQEPAQAVSAGASSGGTNDARLLAEVRRLLEAGVSIEDTELRELARLRANAIRHALVADGRVSPERVFLLGPLIEDHEGATGGRVMMSLVAN